VIVVYDIAKVASGNHQSFNAESFEFTVILLVFSIVLCVVHCILFDRKSPKTNVQVALNCYPIKMASYL